MEKSTSREEPPASPIPSEDESIHFGSEQSDTSTLRYDQESFDMFKTRVERLCQILWPSQSSFRQYCENSRVATWMRVSKLFNLLVPARQPLIERLRGGDYNRIIGITLPRAAGNKLCNRDLVLRVPRWGQGHTGRVVATLDYLRLNSSVPVAKVVAKDFGNDNPLGSPYVVQERISGSTLETLWNDLNHPQRCTVAQEVGRVIKGLLALESPVTGCIESSDKNKGPAEAYVVVPFDLKNSDGDPYEESEQLDEFAKESARVDQSTLDFFQSQIGRWRVVDVERDTPMVDRTTALWDGMLKVVEEMNDLGLLKTKPHCLCHVDLYPRNIMVDVQSDGSIQVTGILDWDEAVVAPKFVACEPPGWLWGFEPDTLPRDGLPTWPYEVPGANDMPATPEKKELKCIFEEQAGLEYMDLAYEEHWRIGRALFRIAVFGLTSSENYDAAKRIISDWAKLRLTLL